MPFCFSGRHRLDRLNPEKWRKTKMKKYFFKKCFQPKHKKHFFPPQKEMYRFGGCERTKSIIGSFGTGTVTVSAPSPSRQSRHRWRIDQACSRSAGGVRPRGLPREPTWAAAATGRRRGSRKARAGTFTASTAAPRQTRPRPAEAMMVLDAMREFILLAAPRRIRSSICVRNSLGCREGCRGRLTRSP